MPGPGTDASGAFKDRKVEIPLPNEAVFRLLTLKIHAIEKIIYQTRI